MACSGVRRPCPRTGILPTLLFLVPLLVCVRHRNISSPPSTASVQARLPSMLTDAFSFLALASAYVNFANLTTSPDKCTSYTLISTRATSERQGPSSGFLTMNANVSRLLSGGSVYNTVYPADIGQNTYSGTQNIISQVNSIVSDDPSHCVILQGYSQGATATVDAMINMTSGPSFDAIKGVFLIGNPRRKAGLPCNVDQHGYTSTKNSSGALNLLSQAPIPEEWYSKTLDVCIRMDGICDSDNGIGINAQHQSYPSDKATQSLGLGYLVQVLTGVRYVYPA